MYDKINAEAPLSEQLEHILAPGAADSYQVISFVRKHKEEILEAVRIRELILDSTTLQAAKISAVGFDYTGTGSTSDGRDLLNQMAEVGRSSLNGIIDVIRDNNPENYKWIEDLDVP